MEIKKKKPNQQSDVLEVKQLSFKISKYLNNFENKKSRKNLNRSKNGILNSKIINQM